MWFPKEERGLATSLFASASYFAVAIFSPLAGLLTQRFGWPAPFFVVGSIGIVAAVVWAKVMHEPRKHPRISPEELDHMIAGGAMVDIDSTHERSARPPLSWKLLRALLGNRMLWCSYLGQYCVIALSYFFITWFPIYLVQGRGMSVAQAGLSTIMPAIAGFLGGITGGAVSDLLIRHGWSVSWARKTPYIIGMGVGCCLVLSAFTESNTVIVLLMTLAFFGKGVASGAGTWAIACDTAPREAVGLASSIFNCVGNIGGIVTPIVFGYIVHVTHGYTAGLYFVAAHCLVAAVIYLFFMGKIERVSVA
jgi:ACS family glucarate transporter-like MFS transporter